MKKIVLSVAKDGSWDWSLVEGSKVVAWGNCPNPTSAFTCALTAWRRV